MKNNSTDRHPEALPALKAAIHLIAAVPGYTETGDVLADLLKTRRLRFDPKLSDRATTDWRGTITVGLEPIQEGVVSLAETLVHEQFHRTQAVYAKTLSYWTGVATGTPVWRQLELPAYQAALTFLIALENYAIQQAMPHLVDDARKEQRAVATSFEVFYGMRLIS